MLPSYFDYIFVHRRQKARLRPELSPKFLSTWPEPDRKSPAQLTTLVGLPKGACGPKRSVCGLEIQIAFKSMLAICSKKELFLSNSLVLVFQALILINLREYIFVYDVPKNKLESNKSAFCRPLHTIRNQQLRFNFSIIFHF